MADNKRTCPYFIIRLVFGFDKMSVNWFRSFLSNRTQRVRIDDELSQLENLVSGVPQGGILSPLLYIIYVVDLQLWLKFLSATTFMTCSITFNSHRPSVFLFGKTGLGKNRFPDRSTDLVQLITENRLRHAWCPVHFTSQLHLLED